MASRGDDQQVSVHDAMRTQKTAGSRRRRLKPKSSPRKRSHYVCDCDDCLMCQLVPKMDRLLQNMKEDASLQDFVIRLEEEETPPHVHLDPPARPHSEEMEDDIPEHTLSSEVEDETPEYTLHVAPVKTQLYTTPVGIQAGDRALKTVELTVDTGLAVSVLPRCLYEEHFKEAPLHHSAALLVTCSLVTCSQSPMKVLGCMQATVHRKGAQVPANFYVVDSGTTALMGRDLISDLHLHIEA